MASQEAERYLRLAREMRKRAAATNHPKIAESMLKIAGEYEKLAAFVERSLPENSN